MRGDFIYRCQFAGRGWNEQCQNACQLGSADRVRVRVSDVALIHALPKNLFAHIEHVPGDERAERASVGELLRPFSREPEPIVEYHVDSGPQKGQRMPVQQLLKPIVELGVGVLDAEPALPLISG